MPVNHVAENILGTIGTICWTGQLIPQVWKSYREKSTEGLSHWLVLIWGLSAPFLGVYAIVQNLNIPLILQPQLFGTLALTSWGQCLYYGEKRSKKGAIMMALGVIVLSGAFEAGMIFAVRKSFDKGNESPTRLFGIISSVLIALALVPQYYEIYKIRAVKGISFTFMAIDMAGGIFSDLSLAFKEDFDTIAALSYTFVVVLDGVIVILALFLNPRARRREEEKKADLERASSGMGGGNRLTPNLTSSEGGEKSPSPPRSLPPLPETTIFGEDVELEKRRESMTTEEAAIKTSPTPTINDKTEKSLEEPKSS